MSYNDERLTRAALYLDIETVGNPEAVSRLGPVRPAANLKDPAKIAADIADKQQKRIERAALDCDTLQIVCIGMARTLDDPIILTPVQPEREMLMEFWAAVVQLRRNAPTAPLVGFNCLGFDLPALIRRSQVLRVPMPHTPLGRYRHNGIIDLMAVLTWDGLVDAKSLTTYCALFGLDVPGDDASGADVATLYAAGDLDTIYSHCYTDVLKTRLLAERIGVR